MATSINGVWAIDIGNNSIKALHLVNTGNGVEVVGFDNIQHGKILTGGGITQVEKEELIAISLRQFITNNNIGKDPVIISVPSQNSFARFVTLPPVEDKKIPEIVKFEAAQQIPFDINDVQWDWQLMNPKDAEKKVGLFAITNDVVNSEIAHFTREDVKVSFVQMAPMALYNHLYYDRPELCSSDREATAIVNIGAEITDLVICTQSSVWQRCIAMGGNSFTRAISEAFKLNFEKAEKLKRTAAMSKYARQILQAMKPVFTDLASEIQRSIGFYSNTNPNVKVTKIIAMGGGTKMRGLLNYLQQSLQVQIERPDEFKKLGMSPEISVAKFHDSVCDFGIVYGLGLQVLGNGKIDINLLPANISRQMKWASKSKYFIAASLILFVVSLLALGRVFLDRMNYSKNENIRSQVKSVIDKAEQAASSLEDEKRRASASEDIIKSKFELFNNRDIVPKLVKTMMSIMPNEKNNPEQQELYTAFSAGDIESVKLIPRKDRKQIFVTDVFVKYSEDLSKADFTENVFNEKATTRGKGSSSESSTTSYDLSTIGGPLPSYGDSPEAGTSSGRTRPGAKDKASKSKFSSSKPDPGHKPGFVVVVSGYSPYKNLDELMNPADAADNMEKWGIITRLMNISNVSDSNFPFELYSDLPVHFDITIDDVSIDSKEMPDGIGIAEIDKPNAVSKVSSKGNVVLLDPLTKEVISKVPNRDENGKIKIDSVSGKEAYSVNDRWFRLKVKIAWKEAAAKTTGAEKGAKKSGTGSKKTK